MTSELARTLYQKMFLIRHAEEMVAARYPEGEMRCPTHLSVGQEAVPAAVGAATQIQDLAVSTHRCHAHYLGKGGSLNGMIAELYGKATGCTRGKGGSMHLMDESVGFMGSTAIVGNSIPVGVGLAMAMQLKKQPNVSVIFFGDGAIEEGAFYESANFAAVRSLPVLFVCENNLYSVYSSLKPRQPEGRKIANLARAIGLNVFEGDGNDVEASYQIVSEARAKAVAGKGPQFLELMTYRWREHCGPFYDNQLGYRDEAEFEKWKTLDPVKRFRERSVSAGWMTAAEIEKIEKKAGEDVEKAFLFAKQSPFPNESEAFSPIFKENVKGKHEPNSNVY